MSKLLPIAGIDKAATITNALLVKLCLEQGKTLEQSIKVVNDSYSPVGCFSHSDGYKGNSCVALINGNIVVFAQLDSPKHPLKPSRWNGAQIVRLKTTEMTDEEKTSIIPVTGFIRRTLARPYENSKTEIHVTASGGSSSQSASSAVGIDELQALIQAAFTPEKKNNKRK